MAGKIQQRFDGPREQHLESIGSGCLRKFFEQMNEVRVGLEPHSRS
jgi:hypothetical protein